jgi:WS/DGAT/MGAT family acyltransferase
VRKELAFSRPFAVEAVRAVASRIGGKVNDVLLAACAGAARADLLRRGWDGRRDVRALIPVHVPGGRADDALGNHIGLVFVELPISEPDRQRRLALTRERMDRVKEQPDASVALTVLAAMGVASSELEHVGVQVLAAKASALVTNVPGPTAGVHLGGHPIDSMVVWAPVSGGIGLGFSLLSYAGQVRLGVASDARRVADPAALIAAFEDELSALLS